MYYGNPLQCSCLENPRDGGAWWAAVYGVAPSRTRLKRLSSSSSSIGQIGEGNSTPLQYSCLENPMDGGAWWAAVHGVAKSRTQLSDFTFTFHFHALEKEMATHSSVLAWRIPGAGEPGGLPSMGSHRVGHDWSDLAVAVSGTWQAPLPRDGQTKPCRRCEDTKPMVSNLSWVRLSCGTWFLRVCSQRWCFSRLGELGVRRLLQVLRWFQPLKSQLWNTQIRDFPSGPVAKTPYFQCRGLGSIPG